MDGGVSRSATAAGPSGGRKQKGENPTGGLVMFLRWVAPADGPEIWLSGAEVAPGTRPAPPQALPQGRASV